MSAVCITHGLRHKPCGIILTASGSAGAQLAFAFVSDEAKDPLAVTQLEGSEEPGLSVCGFEERFLASMLSPKKRVCEQVFSLSTEVYRFISYPWDGSSGYQVGSLDGDADLAHKSDSISNQDDLMASSEQFVLKYFNLAIVLPACITESEAEVYENVVREICNLLKWAERVSGILTEEMSALIRAKRSWLYAQKGLDLSAIELNVWLQKCREVSGIVRSLISAFDDLKNRREHTFSLGSVSVPITLSRPEELHQIRSSIRPFSALLMTEEDRQALTDNLRSPVAHYVRKLVLAADPLRSLSSLALITNVSLPVLCESCARLVVWNQASIVRVLRSTSQYVLSPDADLESIPTVLGLSFSTAFPSQEGGILGVLKIFNVPRSLSSLSFGSGEKGSRQILIVAWLLRHGLIVEIHKLIKLLVPAESLPVEEGKSDSASHKAILQKAECYLQGKCSIDEIAYQTNCDQKTLRDALLYYDEFVITARLR